MIRIKHLGLAAAVIIVAWFAASLTLFPAMAISVADNPVTETPDKLGIEFENIRVTSKTDEGTIELAGWWMPAEHPKAILLFSHGAGSNRTSWFLPSIEFYAYMVRQGISVITVDMRNHGNSPKTDGTLGMGAEEWPDALAMANWLDDHGHTELPRIAMGISMGGATTIHAVHEGLAVEGIILFDPALNTADALAQGGWISFGLPPILFAPYAWATTTFWGLPRGDNDALMRAIAIDQPTLLIQDPTDPITRRPYAEELAAGNASVEIALAPQTPADAECLAGKGRWGAHVAAFKCHEDWTKNILNEFLAKLIKSEAQG